MFSEIRSLSNLIGIDDVAVIDFEPLKDMKEIFIKRQVEGRRISIESEYISERIDPNYFLKDGKSIIVFFWQIPFVTDFFQREDGYGQLASVSWGLDYHKVLGDKIKDIDNFLKKKKGPGYRSYQQVDTGPLYERGFALKTGLGFQGKNASFIHRDLGSFVAIGLLLTNIEIGKHPVDINRDDCGTCRKCIDSCPGKAISIDGKIDPRLCRSWITQKKDDLTKKEERILGDFLYGCDVCQRVCPKNLEIFKKREIEGLDKKVKLSHLENLSNREFKKRYGHLSGAWRGLKIWKRNASIIQKNLNGNDTIYSEEE